MGCSQTKEKSTTTEEIVEGLKNKVRLLQGEINEIMSMRDGESQIYERELMVFALKQEECKRERHILKGEINKLGKILLEKEEMLRCMESNYGVVGENYENEWGNLSTKCVMEHIEEEKIKRDQTVEKWKQLYFAIKVELDDLIQRTHQEERICWGEDDKDVVELMKELREKEEKIEILQEKLASMEHQEFKREREMDILRQSLRIMSHKKKSTRFDKVCSRD